VRKESKVKWLSYLVMKNKKKKKLKKKKKNEHKNKNQLVPVSLRVCPPLNNSSAELSSFANSIPFCTCDFIIDG
jgi:hypothetical protein